MNLRHLLLLPILIAVGCTDEPTNSSNTRQITHQATYPNELANAADILYTRVKGSPFTYSETHIYRVWLDEKIILHVEIDLPDRGHLAYLTEFVTFPSEATDYDMYCWIDNMHPSDNDAYGKDCIPPDSTIETKATFVNTIFWSNVYGEKSDEYSVYSVTMALPIISELKGISPNPISISAPVYQRRIR